MSRRGRQAGRHAVGLSPYHQRGFWDRRLAATSGHAEIANELDGLSVGLAER